MSRCRHVHSSLLPLLHPFFDHDFEVCRLCFFSFSSCVESIFCSLSLTNIQATLSLMLPDDVWRDVLEYVDPFEYCVLARRAAGVSREFYWLLKNSLTTIRVHRPVTPLCGVVWLHSRDKYFSFIRCVEGEDLSSSPPLICRLLPFSLRSDERFSRPSKLSFVPLQ